MACIDALEPRRLLASVAPGFGTDVSYGGAISDGTAMDFTPDGRLWVTTQGGTVRVIQPNATTSTLALTLTVDSFFERGLLGIAFDPAFGVSNNYVYLYRTIPSSQGGPYNRLARFNVTGNTIDAGSEAIILNLNPLSAGNHNGGGLHFGPDGKLYLGVGENAVGSNAQTVNNLLGKMLRLNPDPSDPIPTDNPANFTVRQGGIDVVVTPTGNNRAIWAVGLRNPYTFAFQPGTGRLHINDVGQNTWEEVNVGQAGANYGWNTTEGDFTQASFPAFTRPLHVYNHTGGATAITGGTFYNPTFNQFGSDYTGDYFFADLGAGWIRRLDAANAYQLVSTGGVGGGANFLQGGSSIVDLKVDSNGTLLFLQRGGGNGGAGVRAIRTVNPQVTSKQFLWTGNTLPNAPHRLEFKFTNNVGPSMGAIDLLLEDLTNSTTVPTANIAVSYNSTTNTATFTFPGYTNGILPDATYRATLLAPGVTDPEGDPLLSASVVDFFVKAGDADHNGIVNFDDYARIDTGFNSGLTGWENGDFDYNGIVNFDDYAIIDLAFNQQNRPGNSGILRARTFAPPAGGTFGSTPIGQGQSSRIVDLAGDDLKSDPLADL